ncbi:aminoglycoside phosphotransferase family protein [Actinacidiphila bryophytorum]|uniref:Aminoglycoside phosphotransferase family protein n=1 Tax=Actinacidiphila bryophytorum TaxID=1436133 RepID=A0A9W4E7T2_9ACTN|nr:aminoglycoside phosphotransferase family protein [Actinacidiphila bryophytorum]MBM9436068.1 aminoglycoside phosphotransferase family protein [Actinacidiphila bryophytorum]MBN6542132.1 aminoglycoside phosphotransferase family protein [Actinacidiphila bryophytorum]CAG7634709.1 Aminoglycoside phosphotransferase family protein [Actinacidiphila bryophytorum]
MASDSDLGSGAQFTSAAAARVMASACRAAGLDASGAAPIRLGENALYRLAAAPVVVRVARGPAFLPSARREVAVSRWLADEGFPAVRVVEDIEQPLMVEEHPVTFWHLIEDAGRPATYGELGSVLRELHSLTPPANLGLPPFDAFGRADRRIEMAEGISDDDRVFLRKRRRELADLLAGLAFDSGTGPVHGDAHTDNLMVDRDGRLHLIDLENFCLDRSEWDLVVSAHEYDRLGWVSADEYSAFVRGYGRDLREWSGFRVLSAVQEFKMTTWLMQNIAEGPHIAAEVRNRLTSLRDDEAPRSWEPY